MKPKKYKYIKYYLTALLSIFLGGLVSSCVDEKLMEPDEPDQPILPSDSFALRFKINLETMTRDGNTSDFEKLEDYIDPTKLHVLFFFDGLYHQTTGELIKTDNYNTLIKHFGPDKITLVPISSTGSNATNEWYVHIPILENNEEFGNLLRNNNFKVGVLANWPNTNLSFKEYNSSNRELGDNVHKLHHVPVPNAPAQGDDPYTKEETYKFLFEGENTLGSYMNWVTSGKSTQEAREFILNEYGPGINENNRLNPLNPYAKRTYDQLWQRWNFTDAYNYIAKDDRDEENQFTPSGFSESWGQKWAEIWAERNYNEFFKWFHEEKPVTDESDNSETHWEKINDDDILESFGNFNDPNCYFVFETSDIIGGKQARIKTDITINGKEQTGIVLYKGDRNNNVIRIKIPNNGELNIKWGSLNKGTEAKIKLDMRNHLDDSGTNSTKITGITSAGVSSSTNNEDKTSEIIKSFSTYNPNATNNKNEVVGDGNEIKITGDAEYLFIYNEGDAPAVIYEIEYISSYYIHNIDNVGKKLDKNEWQLIPMYGIQSFERLGDFWKTGTVFDLSNFNYLGPQEYPESEEENAAMIVPYQYKSVSLLRSVAKVELKIPKIYKAHHIFLRSINRRSRCEPVDVSTPTDKIWNKTLPEGQESTGHGDDCHDWGKIFGHTPFFKSTGTSSKEGYQKKLAWYYGNWADEKGEVGGVSPISDERTTGSNDPYPHIMNAMIGRTDFTEFIEAGSDSYYDRYILYVPDKYVDDPGSIGEGMETTTPKVCHIEFREDSDPFTNIDDNFCYRIYFTDGGFYDAGGANHYPSFGKTPIKDNNGNITGTSTDDETWENYYEQNVDNLQNHWPIIRNHYYRFTVIDSKNRMVVCKLEVLPWRVIDDNRYSW